MEEDKTGNKALDPMRSPPDQKTAPLPLELYRESERVAGIFYWFTFAILVTQVAGIVITLTTNNAIAAKIIAVGILPVMGALFLIHRGKFEGAAIFLALTLLSLLTLLATYGLGIHQISNLGFPAILIIASLVTKRRTMILLTLYTIGCLAWLVFGELAGAFTPAILVKSVPGDFFSASLTILLVAFMVRFLAKNLFQSNVRLQTELRERKLAEQKYRNIFENAIDGIFQSTLDGRFMSVNPAMAYMYGYASPEEMVQDVTNISDQLYVEPELRNYIRERLVLGEQITGFESLDYRKDGSTFWASMNVQAIRDADGKILYYEGAVKNITLNKMGEEERKQAERTLRESEERLQVFFNQSLDGFFFSMFESPKEWNDTIDKEKILKDIFTYQRYTDVNNALLEQYGITREKFLSLTSNDIFAHDPQQGLDLRRQLFDKGRLHTETYERKDDGTPAWFEGEYVCIYDEQKRITGFFGIQRDVTKRKQAEIEREQLIRELAAKNAESETLRESLASIVGTFEFSRIITNILDQINRVIPYDSASVWKLEGNLQKFISGRNLPQLFSNESVELVTDEKNSALPILKGEAPYILSNNVQEELADFNESPHTYVNSWLAIPLKTRGKIIGLIALDGKAKGQFNEHHAELAVVFANQVAIALENASLFSELQNELSEREKLIQELESKNAELEQFTYTVSHDLKSPLVTINGFLGYLEGDTSTGNTDRIKIDIQRIQEAVNKMHLLLKELLELSRVGRLMSPPEIIPFEDLVHEALDLVHGQIEARKVTVHIQPNLPTVYGDRQRLIEVLQNLIDNSVKYMGEQPDPHIEIGMRGEEHDQHIFFVKDNGMGISPEYHNRIFGLFDKLDPRSDGTGIGLALVKRIVEVHKGRIWVESIKEKGTTILFSLPQDKRE